MNNQIRSDRNIMYITITHMACLCLGVGAIVWGLAPAIVERLVTHRTPSVDAFLMNSMVFVLGCAFIGIHVLVRQRIRWAIWAAFLLSAMLAAAGLALITVQGIRLSSTFLPLFSGATCFASWLAIATSPRRPLGHAIRNALGFKSRRPMFTELPD